MAKLDETSWFEFVESGVFSRQVAEVGADVLVRIQSDLGRNPKRGAIVKRTHGVRKARVADPASSRGKSGSYRCLYLYLKHAGRITCSISSAKVRKLTYRRGKSKSSER